MKIMMHIYFFTKIGILTPKVLNWEKWNSPNSILTEISESCGLWVSWTAWCTFGWNSGKLNYQMKYRRFRFWSSRRWLCPENNWKSMWIILRYIKAQLLTKTKNIIKVSILAGDIRNMKITKTHIITTIRTTHTKSTSKWQKSPLSWVKGNIGSKKNHRWW